MLLASGGPVAAASSVTACLARPRRVVGRGIPRPAAAARGVHVGTADGVRGGGAGAARQRGEGGKRLCAVGSTSGGLLFPFAERGTRRPSEARGVRVRAAGRGGVDTARQCGWGGGGWRSRLCSPFHESCLRLSTLLIYTIMLGSSHRFVSVCSFFRSSTSPTPGLDSLWLLQFRRVPLFTSCRCYRHPLCTNTCACPPPPRLPHATTR